MTEHSNVPRVLSIAGTDPTGGAGIQADLKSIAANGGYGMAVITALVAQNTRGVRSIHTPPAAFLAAQLDSVSEDVTIDAVKIGMLATREPIHIVREWLARQSLSAVVLDPVMVATSGDRLLDSAAERSLRDLCAQADLLTPNVPELAILAEQSAAPDLETMTEQAIAVSERYSAIVLAKGGHLVGDVMSDVLVDATNRGAPHILNFTDRRIATENTHGTGCSLSSALATQYARSRSWRKATNESLRWLRESIRHGPELGVGLGHGPISHFAGLWARGGVTTNPTPAEVETEWWDYIADIRDEIDALGFVRGLEAGTAPLDAFAWYMTQDALYLRDYSRVLAQASRLAPTTSEQAFWAESARTAIAGEMLLHDTWIPADQLQRARPSSVTSAYLNHLFACAARGDYAVLVAALLPCFWIYHDVGTRLHRFSHPNHPYRSWLDTYGDEAFAESARNAVGIVTRVAASVGAVTRSAMRDAFRISALHERAFFADPCGRKP